MSAIEQEAEVQLGRQLLECGSRRRSAVWLDLGGSWIQLILTPLAAAIFITIAASAICQKLELPDNVTLPSIVFLFVATAIGFYFMFFTAPDAISLALHERGFRYKKRLVPFADLMRIRAGSLNSGVADAIQSVAQSLGTFHRGLRVAAAINELSARVTLTAWFKDGSTLTMKNALFEYHESDLRQFFDWLRDQHPELLDVDGEAADDKQDAGDNQAMGDLEFSQSALAVGPQPAPDNAAFRHAAAADLAVKTEDGIDPTFGNVTARDTRNDLAWGNYRSASWLLSITKDPKLREFYVSSLQQWTGHPVVFETWKQEEPENADAWLVSGAQLIDWAWQARGSDSGSTVGEQAAYTFHERLRLAESDLERAAYMNMNDPTPHAFQLRVCLGLDKSREATLANYEQAVRRCPDHYLAHTNFLTYLCEKWHGSHDEMFAFARGASQRAAEGSLLSTLIPQAHTERWLFAVGFDNDPRGNDYFKQEEVRQEILAAYSQSLGSPRHLLSPLSHFAANYFAYTLDHCGEWDLAAQLCQRIGQHPTKLPWALEGNPIQVYQQTHARLTNSAVEAGFV